MMITRADLVYILRNLPNDIVKYIIAAYDPLCFFIMDEQWLSNYDWTSMGKLLFNMPCDDFYMYCCVCQRFDKLYQKRFDIACGGYHTVISKGKGCGYGNFFGVGDKFEYVNEFKDIPVKNAVQIACGLENTIILDENRKVMAAGNNADGQLGLGDVAIRRRFEEITMCMINGNCEPFPKDVVQITCGVRHVVILRANGTVMSCGLNAHYQLGLGDYINRNIFTEVPDLPRDIVHVACGANYTFLVRANGTLMSCGRNNGGQLGHNGHEFQEVENVADVVQIACGEDHTIILKSDGTLMGCGSNVYGQLGMGMAHDFMQFVELERLKNITRIACGGTCTFLVSDSMLFCTGRNCSGQLGLGDTSDRYTFTRVDKMDNIVHVACGRSHTFAVKSDGSLMACGSNTYHQLGFADRRLQALSFDRVLKFENMTV